MFASVRDKARSSLHSSDDKLDLLCLIEGESTVFTVTVSGTIKIEGLKVAIRNERARDTLREVGPHVLDLWKVSAIDEPRLE
jgi:hypothetical protein